VAKAFLHRQQHICIASGLDMNHAVGMKSREVQCWREQVAPAQAPEDRTLDPGKDAGEKHRRAGVVGKVGAACNLVERPGGKTATRQMAVDRLQAKRQGRMAGPDPFDPRYPRTQIFDDCGLVHDMDRLGHD